MTIRFNLLVCRGTFYKAVSSLWRVSRAERCGGLRGHRCGCGCLSCRCGASRVKITSPTARTRAISSRGYPQCVRMRAASREFVQRNNTTVQMGSVIAFLVSMAWIVRYERAQQVMLGLICHLRQTRRMAFTPNARIWGTATGRQVNALAALALEGRRVMSCFAQLEGYQKDTWRALWPFHAAGMAGVSL